MTRSSASSWLVFGGALLAVFPMLARPGSLAAQASTHTETVAAPPAADADDTVLTFSLGATLNMGNTRAVQGAAALHFLLKRDQHLFTLDLAGTVGLAAARDPMTRQWGELDENSRNIVGRLRYDFFLDPDDAIFAVIAGRHDQFAGLDFRFQGQVGYLRNFFREGEGDSHRAWGEVGFDVTVDDRFPNPLPNPDAMVGMCDSPETPMPGMPPCSLANVEDQYSVRLFLGYDNHMSESWTFRTGLEALFDVVHGDNVRLSSISELNFHVDNNLQAGLRFTLFYDHVPVPGTDPVDTTTVLNVIYTML